MNFLALILVPLLGGLCLFAFRQHSRAAQIWNFLVHAIWISFLYFSMSEVSQNNTGGIFPIVFSAPLFPMLKSQFSLGADGLNMPLVALNIFLSTCLAFYAWKRDHLNSKYLGLFNLLNAASVGSLLAADIFSFYVFWEFMLIPLFFLILKWGSKNRNYAALKFFAFTMAGSLFLLLAIISLAVNPEVLSLSWHDLHSFLPSLGNSQLGVLLFAGFMAAFVVKIPV